MLHRSNRRTGGGGVGALARKGNPYPTPSPPTPLRTFYVDAVGGNDANAGTEGAPFKTTTKINTTMQAGDRFYLKGEFTGERIGEATADSGTSSNPIQFYAWPGETAWLHCGGGVDGYPAIYCFAGITYWWFDGIKVTPASGSGDAVLTVATAANCTFVNCEFASGQVRLLGAPDFAFYDCDWTGTVGDQGSNTGDGVFTQSGSHRAKFVRCSWDFQSHHAAVTLGSFQNAANPENDDFLLHDCYVRNPVAGGVNINGKSNGGTVEWCRFFDVGTNSTQPSQTPLFIASHDIVARYNQIWGCGREGIKMQGYVFSSFTQSCHDNHVHNNTVFDCDGMALFMAAANNVDPNVHLADNIIENNIFWTNNQGPQDEDHGYFSGAWYSIWLHLFNTTTKYTAGTIGGNILRHNIVARSTVEVDMVLGVRLYDLTNTGYSAAAFEAAFPACVENDPNDDPVFVSEVTPDFHLQAGSPAIDAGFATSGVGYLGAGVDLGVFEYGGAD